MLAKLSGGARHLNSKFIKAKFRLKDSNLAKSF